MKKIIIAIIIIIPSVIGLTTIMDTYTYGLADSKNVLEAINKNITDTITCSGSFLKLGDVPVIYRGTTPGNIFFKYYINNIGLVYRYSEASYKLDSIYNIFETTERQKLGLD